MNQNCYNYVWWPTSWCNKPSNEKESAWNSTYGIDNIWWKLYYWDNIESACPDWRKVPSDEDFAILEQSLWCSSAESDRIAWWCDGLWWKNHTTRDYTNNMIEALKLPLAGFRDSYNVFYYRWHSTYLWSSTPDSTKLFGRPLSASQIWVFRASRLKNQAFSVRCIRN